MNWVPEEYHHWVTPTLITTGILVLLFLASRSRAWWYRKIFWIAMKRVKWIGPWKEMTQPSSQPPSKDSIAFTSIFAQFPKLKQPKPAHERRAAYERLGALQSVNQSVKFRQPFRVPLLPTSASSARDGVTVHPIHPAVSLQGKVNIYLHGGTYISGSINSHRGLVSHLAELSHRLTYFVEYGLGPEHPVPKGVDDVIAVYDWLLKEQNIEPQDIMIIGDSAGGGLALLVVLELRKREYVMPGGLWLMSPWTDLSCTGSSWKTHLKYDVMLNPFDFCAGSVCLEHATGIVNSTVEQLQDPTLSPLFAPDLSRLPPCLIQVGGAELLLSDSIELHKKLIQQRVKSTLQIYDHQQHVFQLFYDWIPESNAGIAAGIKWMSQFDFA